MFNYLRNKNLKSILIALLFFIILTCIYNYPLFAGFSTKTFYGNHDDVRFFLMVISWTYHILPHDLSQLFNLPILFPHSYTLTYSEPLLGEALQGFPLFYLLKSIIPVYNFLILFACFTSGFFTFLLIKDLTKSNFAAIAAGILMLSPPEHYSELAHIQSLQMQWLPLFLWASYRFFKRGGFWYFLTIIFSLTLLIYSNLYYAVFLVISMFFFLPVFIVFSIKELEKRRVFLLIIAALIVLILAIPLVMAFENASTVMSHAKNLSEVEHLSADLLDFFSSSAFIYYDLTGKWMQTEGHFGGIISLFLSLIGLIILIKNWKKYEKTRAFFISTYAAAFGTFIFALGPVVKFYGKPLFTTFYPFFYHYLPGLNAIRAISRLGIFTNFFLLIGAGLGASFIEQIIVSKKLKSTLTITIFSLIILGITIESVPPINRAPVVAPPTPNPLLIKFLKAQKPYSGALELPVFSFLPHNSIYEWWQIQHWQPIIVAHTSNYPQDIRQFAKVMQYFPSNRSIGLVQSLFPVKYVVIHGNLYSKRLLARVLRRVKEFPNLHFLHKFDDDYIFKLDRLGIGTSLDRLILEKRLKNKTLEIKGFCADPLTTAEYKLILKVEDKTYKVINLSSKNGYHFTIRLKREDLLKLSKQKNSWLLTFKLDTKLLNRKLDLNKLTVLDFKGFPIRIEAVSRPYHRNRISTASILINETIYETKERGLFIALINPFDPEKSLLKTFDTSNDANASDELINFIKSATPNSIIAGAVCDDAAAQLSQKAVQTLKKHGLDFDISEYYRYGLAFIVWGKIPKAHSIYKTGKNDVSVKLGTDEKHFNFKLREFKFINNTFRD